MLLYYYITILLYYYITVVLYSYFTVLLNYYYLIILLYYYIIILLYYYCRPTQRVQSSGLKKVKTGERELTTLARQLPCFGAVSFSKNSPEAANLPR